MKTTLETATLAGGCFWCTEALFKRLKGVESVLPGYSGGHVENPSYEDVCTGTTGHAEAIEIRFDPSQIPFEKILDIFMHTHNPTTLNQQGHDVGTQYRSVIFYHSDKQKKTAEKLVDELEKSHEFTDPIVTQIVPYEKFYVAENYHKDYFDKNTGAPYCNIIISPKIHKLLKLYGNQVKDEFKPESDQT